MPLDPRHEIGQIIFDHVDVWLGKLPETLSIEREEEAASFNLRRPSGESQILDIDGAVEAILAVIRQALG